MRRLALLALGVMGLPAMALTNVDLYRAEIVIDQSENNADTRAREAGMKQVIIRASGDPQAADNEVVKKALSQSAQYVSQLGYGKIGEETSLRMSFSGPHIRSLLSQAQLPLWPATRANVLVWMVEETSYDRTIIWEHSRSETLVNLQQQARERGLPVTVPVGDFDDVTGVAVSDLWGGFIQPVGQASQRYPVDAVLVVKVQGESLRWTLYDQKPATIGVTRQAPISGANNGADAANKMINQISDYYAKKSAVLVASESSESVKARFIELNDAMGFFQLENKLKALSSVASLDIIKIQGNQVTFDVHLLASVEEFEQQVSALEVTQLETQFIQTEPEVGELTPTLPVQGSDELNQPSDTMTADSTLVETESSLAASAPLIQTETVLLFQWQGKPYQPEPLLIQPDSVVSANEAVAETEGVEMEPIEVVE